MTGPAAIVFCPHPPALLPGATGRPVTEIEELRVACLDAIGSALAAGCANWLVIGGWRDADQVEPLSLQVGHALLAEAMASEASATAGDSAASVRWVRPAAVPEHLAPDDCAALACRLPVADSRIGVLVMGDGSACRSVKAPGYFDERAAGFDAVVEQALATADTAALAGLDPELAAELLVAGRAAWQVGAAVADGGGAAVTDGGGAAVAETGQTGAGSKTTAGWSPSLRYAADPFGVRYLVAVWLAV